MKAYSTRNEYDEETRDFLNDMGIHYAMECYTEEDICTICEDGQPKAWCWEADEYL